MIVRGIPDLQIVSNSSPTKAGIQGKGRFIRKNLVIKDVQLFRESTKSINRVVSSSELNKQKIDILLKMQKGIAFEVSLTAMELMEILSN